MPCVFLQGGQCLDAMYDRGQVGRHLMIDSQLGLPLTTPPSTWTGPCGTVCWRMPYEHTSCHQIRMKGPFRRDRSLAEKTALKTSNSLPYCPTGFVRALVPSTSTMP